MLRRKEFCLMGMLLASAIPVCSQTESVRAVPALPTAESEQAERDLLPPGSDPENRFGWPLLRHLAADQKAFWTSATKLRRGDEKTLLPFAGFTGLLLATDSWLVKQVPDKPAQLRRSQNISQYATYALAGAAGGSFLWGSVTKNDHLRETGLLSAEALLNSTASTFLLQGIAQRSRPLEGGGRGRFFRGGSSFPSAHAAAAWSVAGVVAHEYPGPIPRALAYGLASAVTVSRVTGKQHFASDAVIGSALGWYLGRQVYRAHHDPELGGAPWGGLFEAAGEPSRKPENMGSPHVPLDSWVYPALERLAALGYVKSAFLGLRPWTRMECARLLEEAEEALRYDGEAGSQAQGLYEALADEFSAESGRLEGARNLGASLDSIYARVTGIAGPPLRDSYHFGQTLVNDYGRPYGRGLNAITGFTAHAVAGPLSLSVQGEYQHAPATPSHPAAVLQAVAKEDGALPLANGTSAVSRFQVVTATVGLTARNIRFSFGRQSSWLGPGEAGPLLFSGNAQPITMLRIESVAPYQLPLLSRFLGPARSEFFLGQLSGHHWVFANDHLVGPDIDPQPYIHGNKISFRPTPNLEFGMGITALFGGPGLPFTWSNFLRTYYSHRADIAKNPGKRFSAFDFSYRIPGLRKWLMIYNDSLVVDEVSPIGSSRPTLNPGFYLPRLPKIPKLDFRVEALRSARDRKFGPGFVYADRRFRSGYTSDGQLLASWIGRAGTGFEAWSSYWFSPRSRLQLGYRHLQVDPHFLQGGHLSDFGARGELGLRPGLAGSASLQYERWAFPLLSPQPQSNVSASFQLTFFPRGKKR